MKCAGKYQEKVSGHPKDMGNDLMNPYLCHMTGLLIRVQQGLHTILDNIHFEKLNAPMWQRTNTRYIIKNLQ